MVEVRQRFDPAAHLSKQGWKGKGSALKHGHSTRPLAVVKKKTLSGIGKDRDEAIPFWDHIFATTAASIQTSSAGSTPVASTSASPVPSSSAPRTTLTLSARKGKEAARRGLYSRFLKGVTLGPEKVTFDDLTPIESTSAAVVDDSEENKQSGSVKKRQKRKRNSAEGELQPVEKESKEDRKARKEDKARRKAEKELRRKRQADNAESALETSAARQKTKTSREAKKRKKVK